MAFSDALLNDLILIGRGSPEVLIRTQYPPEEAQAAQRLMQYLEDTSAETIMADLEQSIPAEKGVSARFLYELVLANHRFGLEIIKKIHSRLTPATKAKYLLEIGKHTFHTPMHDETQSLLQPSPISQPLVPSPAPTENHTTPTTDNLALVRVTPSTETPLASNPANPDKDENTPPEKPDTRPYYQKHPGRIWAGILIGLACALLFVPPLAAIVLPALGLGALLVAVAPTASAIFTLIGEALLAFTVGGGLAHLALWLSDHFHLTQILKPLAQVIGGVLRGILILPVALTLFFTYLSSKIFPPLSWVLSGVFFVAYFTSAVITSFVLLIGGLLLNGIGWIATPLAALSKKIGHDSVPAKIASLILALVTFPFWIVLETGKSLWKVAMLLIACYTAFFTKTNDPNDEPKSVEDMLIPEKARSEIISHINDIFFLSETTASPTQKPGLFKVLDEMQNEFPELPYGEQSPTSSTLSS